MSLRGKGFFTWNLPRCEGGDPGRIAGRASDSGLSHVLIKIGDGVRAYGDQGLNRAVADALRERGLQVWGWHYVYGREPEAEARVAIDRMRDLKLDGFCIDAEAEYKETGRDQAARVFMNHLRGALPDTPIALSTYRYPSLHTIPWGAFLERCDFNMPQVYWEQSHNPDQQLARSVRELSALQPKRPVFPTGAAYGANGWTSTPADIHLFLKSARDTGLAGANFWSWDYAGVPTRSSMWNAVADFDWPPEAPEEPNDPSGESRDDSLVRNLFNALNAFDLDAVGRLYHSNAVHITGRRLVMGRPAVRTWYEDLINRRLRRGAFTLGAVAGGGAFRRFTWAADSYSGTVEDGQDTLGLRDGKIQYHYTYFSVLPN